jgi:uroporphyrinogen decarboxylase
LYRPIIIWQRSGKEGLHRSRTGDRMNSVERFYATIQRHPVDRPAVWLGIPDTHSLPGLFKEYGVNNLHSLKLAVGDDFYAVELPYDAPDAHAIYAAFNWYGENPPDDSHRTLTADGCFKDAESLSDLDFYSWPEPEKNIDPAECRRRVDAAPKDKAVLGVLWSAHFQDACAAFGMETAMINMLENPEVYEAVNDRIVDFYLRANRIFFENTKHRLNAVLIGNDVGSQRALMISPNMVRKFVIPGCKMLVDQAHEYGVKVIYHSCGAIADVIPDLIKAGVDAIHPIQTLAHGMSAAELQPKFGGKVSFCGGIDVQALLVKGSPEEISKEIGRLRGLFPTGLILSPSHEAILPDVPPKNIRAMFEAATRTA